MTDHQTAQRLLAMENVLILTHRRPDGDTIGCACALCLALRQLGKTAWVLPVPTSSATVKSLFSIRRAQLL